MSCTIVALSIAALGTSATAAQAASWTAPVSVWEGETEQGLGPFDLQFAPDGAAVATWQTTGETMTGRTVNAGLLDAVGGPNGFAAPAPLVPGDANVAGVGIDSRKRALVLVEDLEPDPDVPDVRTGVSAWSGQVTDRQLGVPRRQVLSHKPGIAALASNPRGERVAIWRSGSQPTSTGRVSAAIARPGHRFARTITITRERAASAAVAMNARGDTVVVWQVGGRIKARIRAARARGFNKPMLVGRASDRSADADPTSVAVDPTGNVGIAWRTSAPAGRSLLFATARPGRGFAEAVDIDRSTATGASLRPSLAALGTRRFLVAWAAPEVKTAVVAGTRVGITVIDQRPALGLTLVGDPSGQSALAWRTGDGDSIWFSSRTPASGFGPPELAIASTPSFPSLAIDPASKTPALLFGGERSLAITFRTP